MTRRPFKVLFRSQYLPGSDVELPSCGQMIVISSMGNEGFQNEFSQSISFNLGMSFNCYRKHEARVENCNIGTALHACATLRL